MNIRERFENDNYSIEIVKNTDFRIYSAYSINNGFVIIKCKNPDINFKSFYDVYNVLCNTEINSDSKISKKLIDFVNIDISNYSITINENSKFLNEEIRNELKKLLRDKLFFDIIPDDFFKLNNLTAIFDHDKEHCVIETINNKQIKLLRKIFSS